jgi:putative PEP-CTERM system TPR-repeat lipoprotein
MSSRRRGKERGSKLLRNVSIALLVVAALAVVYVLKEKNTINADELLVRARQQFEAGEYQGSSIDLKTVISADPNNREARFLLATVYLKDGNPSGALKEFGRARELGETDPSVALGIARALLLTGKFDEGAAEIALNGDTSKPDWMVLRGLLDLAQQRLDDARATFRGILEEDANHEEARRGLMQAELAAGNADLARKEVEELIKSTEANAGLWIIKGELDLHDNNLESAQVSFEKAQALEASNPLAHIGLARALIGLERIDAASRQLDQLDGAGEEDPRVNFLRARISEIREDPNSALRSLRKVLMIAPMHRESLILAAKLHFSRGEFTRSQDYVSRILAIDPNNAGAQRILGAIQLAAGRMDGLEGLASAARDPSAVQDPGMLALLGTAYLKNGKYAESQASLERAADLAPDSLSIRTQLALSYLSAGEPEIAVTKLEAILAEDPNFTQAEIMLALVYMSQSKMEAALKVAENLAAHQPQSALAQNVHGYVLEVSGDKNAARAAFQSALKSDAKFHPARINLARLAISDANQEAGRAHFQAVLDIEPFHGFALLGLAALALQGDDLDEAERLWLLAREHNPDAVAPRLLLAKHYRAKNNGSLAQTTIKEAYKLAPFALQVQAEYAEIMLEAGEFQDALSSAEALVGRAPNSVFGLELLARIHNQLGDENGLTNTLKKIAELAPNATGAQVLLGRLAIRRKDFSAAEKTAKALSSTTDNLALGQELLGDIRVAQTQIEQARQAYLSAFEASPATSNVLKLDQMERRLGQDHERLETWLEAHPDDLKVRLVRASYLQQEGSGTVAIPEYERMLESDRANPIVLNNLAWLYHESGDERALDLARRAHELAPTSPEIMDTYGWIMLSSGKHEQG